MRLFRRPPRQTAAQELRPDIETLKVRPSTRRLQPFPMPSPPTRSIRIFAPLLLAALSACGGIEEGPAPFEPGFAKTPPLAPTPQSVIERPIDGLAEAYREGAAERERLMALQMGEAAIVKAP